MKVAAYVRVSTHHQIDRDSLPFQRQELINYCKHVLNIPDYEIFEDAGYSAKNTDRPKFQEMMRRIREGEFTHMLVWKLDRVSRNLRDFTEMWDELQRLRVTFVSKMEQFDTSSAMGAAMLQIILVFAELERKLTGERVMSIMLSRAEKGLWNGAPVPLGYDWDDEAKTISVNNPEAAVVRMIYSAYEETGSTTEVLHQLEVNGVQTKRGGNWTTKTISDILRSPLYKGTLRYNYKESGRGKKKNPDEWILVDDAVTPIITREQWELVQKTLDANYKGAKSGRPHYRHTHLFSSLLHCPDCNVGYVATLDRARSDGYRPSYYRCKKNFSTKKAFKTCHGYIADITLGPFILQYLANLVSVQYQAKSRPNLTPEQIEKLLINGLPGVAGLEPQGLMDTCNSLVVNTGQVLNSKPPQEKTVSFNLERLQQNRLKYERALERLESAYLFDDESISEKDYLLKRGELKARLSKLTEEIREQQMVPGNADLDFLEEASRFLVAESLLSGKGDFAVLIRSSDRTVLKAFLSSVIEQIDIKDNKVVSIRFTGGTTHRFIHKIPVPVTYGQP